MSCHQNSSKNHNIRIVIGSFVYHQKNIKIATHRTLILPVVLCGCETWSLTLKEEHTVGVVNVRTKEG
jgi:hypothetical protein